MAISRRRRSQPPVWKALSSALYSEMPEHSDCKASYDAVAEEYVRRISDELQHKPLDRSLLDRFADAVRDRGSVCDLGCGPGHVARHFQPQQMASDLQGAGFEIEEIIERDPYPKVEHQSRRAYILARRAPWHPACAQENSDRAHLC